MLSSLCWPSLEKFVLALIEIFSYNNIDNELKRLTLPFITSDDIKMSYTKYYTELTTRMSNFINMKFLGQFVSFVTKVMLSTWIMYFKPKTSLCSGINSC